MHTKSTFEVYLSNYREAQENGCIVMKLSRHSCEQMSRRGVPESVIGIIVHYARLRNAKGGAQEYFFGDKEAKQALEDLAGMHLSARQRARHRRKIERAKGKLLIVSGGTVLTAYRRDKPCHPKKRRQTRQYKPKVH